MTEVNTVLIVDDNPDYLRSLRTALQRSWAVQTAASVAQAQQIVLENAGRLRVALVDVCLDPRDDSDRSGFDLVRWIRDASPELPVVVMSALPDDSFPEVSDAAGAIAFLAKPVSVDRLRDLVARTVGSGETRA